MAQNSTSVLVIRLDGIGDALALTPLLAAFRERGIIVDVVLRRENAQVFSAAAARKFFVAPFALRSNTRENLSAIDRFGIQLRQRAYDFVLVATEDQSGYRLAHASGAPRRIGFANGWRKPLKTFWIRSVLTDTLYRPAGIDRRDRHECEMLFELGRPLIGDAEPTRAVTSLQPLVLDDTMQRDDRIAIQVTEKWLRFGATAQHLSDLIQRIAREWPVRAIASSEESSLADAVVASTGVPVEQFSELEPWKRAIGTARALIAPDSGATHVAGMLGTPTVAIFAMEKHLQRQVARWSPWAAPYHIVCVQGEWAQRIVHGLEAVLA